MTSKSGQWPEHLEDGPRLPDGSRVQRNETDGSLTFAIPIGRDFPLTPVPTAEAEAGWYGVLRFVLRDGRVDLVRVRVEWFAPTMAYSGGDREAYRWQVVEADFLRWLAKFAEEPLGILPPQGLSVREVRQLRLGDLPTIARRYLVAASAPGRHLEDWAVAATERSGRKGRESELHWARLAKAYVDHLHSRRPIEALRAALELDGVFLAEKTIRNQINEARDRGLLTRPGRGRAGGELTDKALSILQTHSEV